MKINLWFNKPTNQWRWVLTSEVDSFIMESGSAQKLEKAMDDVSNTVKWIMDQQSNHYSHS